MKTCFDFIRFVVGDYNFLLLLYCFFFFYSVSTDHASELTIGFLALICLSITIIACACCHRHKSGFKVSELCNAVCFFLLSLCSLLSSLLQSVFVQFSLLNFFFKADIPKFNAQMTNEEEKHKLLQSSIQQSK